MQPNSEWARHYRAGMEKSNHRHVLWANLLVLMRKRWGDENINKLATESEFGVATAQRMKAQDTSIGIDNIAKAAAVFDLQPWQLLVPNLDPDEPPMLAGDASEWPLEHVDKKRYLSLSRTGRTLVQGYINRAIEEVEARERPLVANGT